MTQPHATSEPDSIMAAIDEVIMAGTLNGQSVEAIATYLGTDIGLVRERYAAVMADGRLERFRMPGRRVSKPESMP